MGRSRRTDGGPGPGQEGPALAGGLQFVIHSPSVGAFERCIEGETGPWFCVWMPTLEQYGVWRGVD